MSTSDDREILDHDDNTLLRRRQCALVGVAQSGPYQPKKPANDWFALKQIGQLFTGWPSYGSRRMTLPLRQESHKIIRVRVQRYKCVIGTTALCPKPRTTTPAQGHKCYPYLLHDLKIEKPNLVWYAEIIDLPTGCCFLYLVAIMDCARRMVLLWRLPNTIDAASCTEALEEAPARYGKAGIFSTNQGSQFTRCGNREISR